MFSERGIRGQKDVSTKQQSPQEKAWLPRSDEDREGTPGVEATACQGSEEIDRLREAHREKFTREDRLHLRREFEAVYKRGARIPGRHFILFILPNDLGRSRLGVTLSRKVGNAVARNRARRRLREIFRRQRGIRGACLDIVVHGRREITEIEQQGLETEFLEGLSRFDERRSKRR